MFTKTTKIWMLLFVIIFFTIGCSTTRVVTENDCADAANINQDTTVYHYFWGLKQAMDITPTCDSRYNHLNKVQVKNTFGNFLLTMITLGIVVPIKISWCCAPYNPTPGSLGGSTDPERPVKNYFPVPVPFPSAFRYTANFQPNLKTLKQVDNYSSAIFKKAGYKRNLHYYYVPSDGYAMTTGLEKINKDGSPVKDKTRWSANIGDNSSFSFYDVFKSIFFDTKSEYRMFALIVAVKGAGIQKSPSSIGKMQELIKFNYPSLPDDLKNVTLKYKTLSAFAYLFHQSDVGEVPMLDVSSRLSMETHLQKSGLGELLK